MLGNKHSTTPEQAKQAENVTENGHDCELKSPPIIVKSKLREMILRKRENLTKRMDFNKKRRMTETTECSKHVKQRFKLRVKLHELRQAADWPGRTRLTRPSQQAVVRPVNHSMGRMKPTADWLQAIHQMVTHHRRRKADDANSLQTNRSTTPKADSAISSRLSRTFTMESDPVEQIPGAEITTPETDEEEEENFIQSQNRPEILTDAEAAQLLSSPPFVRTTRSPRARRHHPYDRAVTALSDLREEIDTLVQEKQEAEAAAAAAAAAQLQVAERDATIARQAEEIVSSNSRPNGQSQRPKSQTGAGSAH